MIATNTQLILSEATSLLSPTAERLLFASLSAAKLDVAALEHIEGRSLNQNSQLWAAKQRVKRIKGQLVTANLPLVIRVAKRMSCPGISEDQFVGEGLLKLLQCIDAFKVEKGFKFSTYLYRPLYRHFSRFMQKEAKRNAGRVSGDAVMRSQVDTEDTSKMDHVREVLGANIAGLSELEMEAVLHTYGIGELGPPKTLKQLSQFLGMSTGRLKLVLTGAMEKLKSAFIEEKSDEAE